MDRAQFYHSCGGSGVGEPGEIGAYHLSVLPYDVDCGGIRLLGEEEVQRNFEPVQKEILKYLQKPKYFN